MGHTPYGYTIENGSALIDEEKAGKIRKLYENYLSGMALRTGCDRGGHRNLPRHSKRLMENPHYLGDEFYPAIIDRRPTTRPPRNASAVPVSWAG
jgi:hypothetical protein